MYGSIFCFKSYLTPMQNKTKLSFFGELFGGGGLGLGLGLGIGLGLGLELGFRLRV